MGQSICYAARVSQHRPPRRPSISIVGPGNLGTALALTLRAAEYRIESLAVRPGSARPRHTRALAKRVGAQLLTTGKQPVTGHIVWITVPDDAIAGVAGSLAKSGDWKGRIVFHSSGALASDELSALKAKGARIASVHPMMTFVRSTAPQMRGVAFALEGDTAALRAARTIVNRLGGRPFAIEKKNKVLYHAFGSFASPLVIALMASMEQVALAAGIREREIKSVMEPLLMQTLTNYLQRDAASAFSGPLARGDVATIRRHLAALKQHPEVKEVYVALVKLAAKALPVRNRAEITREVSYAASKIRGRGSC